jgi:arsenical pump membrane protein
MGKVTPVQTWVLALAAFVVTALLILWRPGGIHEAVPALLGAFLFFLVGLVDRHDVLTVLTVVWNSAVTIIAMMV